MRYAICDMRYACISHTCTCTGSEFSHQNIRIKFYHGYVMATGTKRKRRVGGQCPNPLFIKWMEEWRDEAREKGVQSQYAYTKVFDDHYHTVN